MVKERGFKWSNGRRKKENGEGRRRRAAALFFRNNLLEATQCDPDHSRHSHDAATFADRAAGEISVGSVVVYLIMR